LPTVQLSHGLLIPDCAAKFDEKVRKSWALEIKPPDRKYTSHKNAKQT
jgi:hypothetical protein